MRIKEIHCGLSGVIPLSSFQNLRPSFDMTVELEEGETPEECFSKIKKELHNQFEMEANRAKADLIEVQNRNIKFRERGGKKYPSVTSITNWDKDWKISEDELRQYGARGNIVHRLIEEYIKYKEWIDPNQILNLKEDLIILATGSLGLSWEDCSFRKFFENCEKDFEWLETEQEVFNDEHLYSGRYDAKGLYKRKMSIIDFKTGSYDMMQLAAYAVATEPRIEQLVICRIGLTDNKSGFCKPDITEEIQTNFRRFLKKRSQFRERFGI